MGVNIKLLKVMGGSRQGGVPKSMQKRSDDAYITICTSARCGAYHWVEGDAFGSTYVHLAVSRKYQYDCKQQKLHYS